MKITTYSLTDTQNIVSPALIYYKDILIENIKKAINIAGDADRLWVHVKSHKMAKVVSLQIEFGISRFKCATIAEAEMVAKAGGEHIILAYPLVGPNIERYINLIDAYPHSEFYAIGDNKKQLKLLSEKAEEKQTQVNVLIDVNVGMNRTGIIISKAEDICRYCVGIKGLKLRGLHCYDGHNNNSNFEERHDAVKNVDTEVLKIVENLEKDGVYLDTIVMGGTPSFPIHAELTSWYLSPGTLFINDAGYFNSFKDLDFTPAAAIFTRVVSHPNEGMFTLDLGNKGVASDPIGDKGILLGYPNATTVSQNEEHWVFKMEDGHEQERPEIGEGLYVIPVHICPTSALYPWVLVVEKNLIVDKWKVDARNRILKY